MYINKPIPGKECHFEILLCSKKFETYDFSDDQLIISRDLKRILSLGKHSKIIEMLPKAWAADIHVFAYVINFEQQSIDVLLKNNMDLYINKVSEGIRNWLSGSSNVASIDILKLLQDRMEGKTNNI